MSKLNTITVRIKTDEGFQEMKMSLFLSTYVFEDFYNRHLGLTKQDYVNSYEDEWSFLYIKMLGQHNVTVTIYQFSDSIKSAESYIHRPSGCTIRFIPTSIFYRIFPKRYLGRYTSAASLGLIKQMKEDRPDVIFVQDYETGRYDFVVLISKILRIGLISQFHGEYPIKILKGIKMFTLRMADKLVAITKDEYKRLLHDYNLSSKKVAYLPNPVNCKFFRPIDKNKSKAIMGLEGKKRYILFVGRLSNERKGLTYLIDAFCTLSSRITENVELLIVGKGPDELFLKNYAKQRGAQNLTFLGWIRERGILPYLYSAMEFFVLPSIHEALPLVILEAMACGLPVVGTAVGGVKDVIVDGQTGYLIPPCDSDAMVDAMSKLLKNENLANEMGRSARERAVNNYSTDIVGNKLYSLLEKTVQSKSIQKD